MKMKSRLMVIYYPDIRNISNLGQFDAKKSAIEKADALVETVVSASAGKSVICVTSDSSILTDREGNYCGDSLPFHISGPGVHREAKKGFTETELATGGQGRISSTSMMDILLSYSNSIGSYFLGDKEDMLYSEGEQSTFFKYPQIT
jgi:2,3-bisphosphoglycerate-independent phosphoglycerate mutase